MAFKSNCFSPEECRCLVGNKGSTAWEQGRVANLSRLAGSLAESAFSTRWEIDAIWEILLGYFKEKKKKSPRTASVS